MTNSENINTPSFTGLASRWKKISLVDAMQEYLGAVLGLRTDGNRAIEAIARKTSASVENQVPRESALPIAANDPSFAPPSEEKKAA